MSLVQCRYNPNHQMKSSRLLIHEDKCPDRNSKMLKMCPYNPIHKVSPFNYESHKRECPQRPKVDENLERELREYLRSQSEMNNNSTKVNTNDRDTNWNTTKSKKSQREKESSSNIISKINNLNNDSDKINNINNFNTQTSVIRKVIGLPSKNEKKLIKTEKRKRQKEMLNLIDNSNFEESGILDNFNMHIINKKRNLQTPNFDEIYEREFMNSSEIQSQNFDITESMLGQINEFMNNTKEELDDDRFDNINEYDPNESDMHIDKRNKNNIYNNLDLDRRDEDFSMIFSTSMSKNI